MYKKMVVLLDGSELAEVVFDYAQELSGRLHIDIELLHVCSPEEVAQLPMRRAYMEQKAEELCARAEEVRAKYDKDAAAQCIQAHAHVVVGYPAEEILKYVDENDVDLVMMSTHGSSGVKDWDLGEVANKVIHASKVPVWLVPTELREEIIADTLARRPMVIPLSGSKQSEAALPYGLTLMRERGGEDELVLLHVVEAPQITVTRAALENLDAERREMKAYLEGLAEPIRASGLDVRTEVLSGDPAETIIDYLKGHPSQLLVMATRGKSRLNRMIFGSVTESVIHMVKVTPLLLVGGED
ncbi:MAG: universal stress protein [Actinomycetia bacterium]|nr:universal stress protein [Actinomycetes bacterium]